MGIMSSVLIRSSIKRSYAIFTAGVNWEWIWESSKRQMGDLTNQNKACSISVRLGSMLANADFSRSTQILFQTFLSDKESLGKALEASKTLDKRF